MAHPQGAMIHGKLYPAISKIVHMEMDEDKVRHFVRSFAIPLENGHRVDVRKRYDRDVISRLNIPNKQTFIVPGNDTPYVSHTHRALREDGRIPEHLKEFVQDVDDFHVHKDGSMFHEYVKSASRLPRFGTSEQYVNNTKTTFASAYVEPPFPASKGIKFLSDAAMTDDELNEHFQDKRNKPREEEQPHNIHLYLTDAADPQKRILQYDYNIKTEQLTTDEEWD